MGDEESAHRSRCCGYYIRQIYFNTAALSWNSCKSAASLPLLILRDFCSQPTRTMAKPHDPFSNMNEAERAALLAAVRKDMPKARRIFGVGVALFGGLCYMMFKPMPKPEEVSQ